jgi:hypothetical protein
VVGFLLTRGMLVGFAAGILCFGFLKIAGEPSVDRAIAFEVQMDAAKEHAKSHADMAQHHDSAQVSAKETAAPKEDPEPELVSRATQSGPGLFVSAGIYATAFGGLFALVFALAYGRVASLGPRATSALLAAMGFVAVYAIPFLKYPANPPSVGLAETIGMRTALYFAMIAISLAAMIAAAMLRNRLVTRFGKWNAGLVAGGAYFVAMIVVCWALPGFDEVPERFPAVVLWQFRIASLGAYVIMWTTIGLAFGALAERAPALRGTFANDRHA